MQSTIDLNLLKLATLEGYLGSYVADSEQGMTLGKHGGGASLNLEAAPALHANLVKAQRQALGALGLHEETEDIVLTLEQQYHLIRMIPRRPGVFICVALERTRANLGLTRFLLHELAQSLEL